MSFENCWYKKVCTQDCNKGCLRYTEMKYLIDNSGIPKSRQYPIALEPDNIDYEEFVKLADIKDTITEFVERGYNLYICSDNL